MKDGRTVLFLGRFQPFHNGHLETVKWLQDHYEKMYIAIGSADKAFQARNPFTAGERWRMVRETLHDEGINHVEIFQVDDCPDDFVWVKQVEKKLPPFQAVVANNPYVWMLMREAGYDGVFTPPYDRKVWSASNVRRLMIHGPNYQAERMELVKWQNLVPDAVIRVLNGINGEERVQMIAKEED